MSIKDDLVGWAKGKAMNKAENGYPSQSAFARYMINPGDSAEVARSTPALGIDLHLKMDAVVSELGRNKPSHFEIICLSYLSCKPDAVIGRKMKMSRSSVRSMRENAEFWIEGRLWS